MTNYLFYTTNSKRKLFFGK